MVEVMTTVPMVMMVIPWVLLNYWALAEVD
jgi:hypothetical protein